MRLSSDAGDEFGELLQSWRQFALAGRLQSFEVRVIADGQFDCRRVIAREVLEQSAERGNHLIQQSDLHGQSLKIPLLPKFAFITDMLKAAKRFGLVEQGDDAQVALQEVEQTAAVRIVRVLCFTIMWSST